MSPCTAASREQPSTEEIRRFRFRGNGELDYSREPRSEQAVGKGEKDGLWQRGRRVAPRDRYRVRKELHNSVDDIRSHC